MVSCSQSRINDDKIVFNRDGDDADNKTLNNSQYCYNPSEPIPTQPNSIQLTHLHQGPLMMVMHPLLEIVLGHLFATAAATQQQSAHQLLPAVPCHWPQVQSENLAQLLFEARSW